MIPGISETSRNLTSGRLSGTYENGRGSRLKMAERKKKLTFLFSLVLPFLERSSVFPAVIAGTVEGAGSESTAIDFDKD